ncbi:conserved hypothetical protein [Talaromyces stipitatus ATCC 10500]|uniref:Uncharacterized protein n=1 Tax=Talaromyces stipitatus (strain ATCC 10500 / CBS 375.48 / QM 6759 / NRRL 1006) TaxID=441959 RepID=B8M4Z8_TALSN|nr:uncharacterized protein TSTA_027300 [Talaromyces stipitatus ATCC 10500]EED19433.1 conserved hypothetical protein [Talaromyces stipitatus ATCC 10500]
MDPNQQQQQQQQQPPQDGAQNEDYLDKGLDFAEKKYGQGKIDPVKMRDTNEKITDGARNLFEKVTGKHVPEKFSN